MPAIKSIRDIAAKWAEVTPGRSSEYEEGVRNPTEDWQTETAGAEDNWEAGVSAAADEGRFSDGVNAAGTDKWQTNTLEKGVGRWGPGVRAGQDAYETGFAPFVDVISRTDLPARYPRGDPRNIERVAAMAEALHEAAQ